jgi:tripartite-type tricarboxylate transporter receptor subunit TctC
VRRRILLATPALLLAASHAKAQAPWPERPLRLVVPFPAGGPIDVLGRVFAQRLSEKLGQQVVVDNKAGAAGAIGGAEVAQSRPDGYTLLVATASTHGLYPLLAKKPLYDARRDFAPVAVIGTAPAVFVVNPAMPADLAGFVAQARANPGKLRYGSPGNGTLLHLTSELLKLRAGNIDVVHVPYRGAAPALNDLIGGHIEMMADTIGTALPQHRAGKTRILAVAAPARVKLAPDIPTVNEALGQTGFEASLWSMLAAPAGVPDAIVQRLAAASAAIMAEAGYAQELARLSIEPVAPMDRAAITAFLDAEAARFKPVVEATGVSIE